MNLYKLDTEEQLNERLKRNARRVENMRKMAFLNDRLNPLTVGKILELATAGKYKKSSTRRWDELKKWHEKTLTFKKNIKNG